MMEIYNEWISFVALADEDTTTATTSQNIHS